MKFISIFYIVCMPILIQMALLANLAGCSNVPRPPERSDYEYDTENDIMPDANGFINNSENDIPIQGTWYWYNNVDSRIKSIIAFTDDTSYIWYDAADTEAYRGEADDVAMLQKSKAEVEEICVVGNLGKLSGDAKPKEQYVGVGFELCSTTESDATLGQFPHVLGTCPLMGKDTLLKTFLGISFKVTFPNEENNGFPDFARFIVQFKERGHGLDEKQPFCYVMDETGGDTDGYAKCKLHFDARRDFYQVEAWHGNASNLVRDRDTESGIGRRNLSALQGIHFEIKTGDHVEPDHDANFEFCLSEIKAIQATSLRSDGVFGELPNLGDVNQEIVIMENEDHVPNNTKCLSSIVDDFDDTDAMWIDARHEKSDTYYAEEKKFWIMKKEVTAAQYYQCQQSGACEKLKEWDSCNPYRYRLAKDSGSKSSQLSWGKKPANCINWLNAKRFCRWVGGDLPSKSQWEYAATAGDSSLLNKYPWGGDVPSCEFAIVYDGHGAGCGNNGVPVEGCQRQDGNTLTGVCDMIGNLWEWVDDLYDDDDFDDDTELKESLEDYRTIKGGGFNTSKETTGVLSISLSTSLEHPTEPHNPNRLGFRCITYENPCSE